MWLIINGTVFVVLSPITNVKFSKYSHLTTVFLILKIMMIELTVIGHFLLLHISEPLVESV